jgi:2-phospho-L-lactate/phosphoenolpyruvate guanylyltransferase
MRCDGTATSSHDRPLRVSGVQATVRRFEPRTRTGDVILDDGTVMRFGSGAFDASGLRLLRLGQRVRLRLGADGAIEFLTIATLADPEL